MTEGKRSETRREGTGACYSTSMLLLEMYVLCSNVICRVVDSFVFDISNLSNPVNIPRTLEMYYEKV
jgi:hypothetical protein